MLHMPDAEPGAKFQGSFSLLLGSWTSCCCWAIKSTHWIFETKFHPWEQGVVAIYIEKLSMLSRTKHTLWKLNYFIMQKI
jgi:hypothetical protein